MNPIAQFIAFILLPRQTWGRPSPRTGAVAPLPPITIWSPIFSGLPNILRTDHPISWYKPPATQFFSLQNILKQDLFTETDRVPHFYKCRILHIQSMTSALSRHNREHGFHLCVEVSRTFRPALLSALVWVSMWACLRDERLSDGYPSFKSVVKYNCTCFLKKWKHIVLCDCWAEVSCA